MTGPDISTLAPGVYPDISFDDYLTIEALSAGAIQTLLTSFPARLKHSRPDTPSLEDGRIAHSLVLEGVRLEHSSRYRIVPKGFSMSHVKKHEELIAEITESGATPISEDRVATIEAMHSALLDDEQVSRVFSAGQPEMTAIWRDAETGVPCKARFDWWPDRGQIMPDYKTCACLDDDALSRSALNYGLAHRSAWYQDAARYAGGRDDEARPPIYLPVWQEKVAPYFVAMRPVNKHHVDLVRPEIRKAVRIYAECLERDEWPGPRSFEPIDLPGWRVRQLEIAAERGESVEDEE